MRTALAIRFFLCTTLPVGPFAVVTLDLLTAPFFDGRRGARLQVERFLLPGILIERLGGRFHCRIELSLFEPLACPFDRTCDRARPFVRALLFVAACRDFVLERLRVAGVRAHLE